MMRGSRFIPGVPATVTLPMRIAGEELEYSTTELNELLRHNGVLGTTITNSLRGPIFLPGETTNDITIDKYWVTVSGQSARVTAMVRARHMDMAPGFNNIMTVERFAAEPRAALRYTS
jgi:hypothetical protein